MQILPRWKIWSDVWPRHTQRVTWTSAKNQTETETDSDDHKWKLVFLLVHYKVPRDVGLVCNHLSFTRTVAGDDNDSLFSAWKLWWCRNSLRYLMTLHFNIALTKCNRTLYNIHWRHGGFHTHVKAWQEIGEQIFMCTGELRTDSYAARCQDCFYTTKTDALWLVLIHCLHFPPPPPYLKFIHNKVRILIQGGGVFIPRCFF